MKLAIYGHGGSQNHGNEAIVRGVKELFPNDDLILYSFSPEVDRKFGLGDICEIRPINQSYKRYTIKHIITYILVKLFKNTKLWYRWWFAPFLKEINKDTIYLLEAGDQYCEKGNHRNFYAYINDFIISHDAKSVMLGCTIDSEYLENTKVLNDLRKYSLIIARESLTYKNLVNKIGSDNVKLAPCPAFAMHSDKCELPECFKYGDVIGMNVGFLSQGNEIFYDRLIDNFITTIQFILDNTNFNIALIPHVNWDNEFSDFVTLNELYYTFKESNRIFIVDENNAPKQKYIIKQCRFFIALRTHATIPALDALVPTIIAGYKTKSIGIAGDIFGTQFNVLAHVQSLESDFILMNVLMNLLEKEDDIRAYLLNRMPIYLEDLGIIQESIYSLASNM